MKKLFLCVILVALSVSAAFGNATEDLFKAVMDANTTPEQITALIKAGANVNAKGEYGAMPLLLATGNGNIEVMKLLLDAGADVNAKNEYGEMPLMSAIQRNSSLEVIETLLNAGADVNARDDSYWTALMSAARNNPNPEVIKVLLNAGADITLKDNNGITAKDYAKWNENPEIQKMADTVLFTSDNPTEDLLTAVRTQDTTLERITALIKAGADLNAKDYSGRTALMIAVSDNPNHEIIKALLDAKADVNAKNDNGKTALMLAAGNNLLNPEIINTLLLAGADLKAKDDDNETAMYYARWNENPEIKKMADTVLFASENPTKDLLKSALDEGATLAQITKLIEAGADLNAKDDDGMTALMLTARYNPNPEVIKALVDAGADINVKDNNGETAKYHAGWNDNPEIQKMADTLLFASDNPTKDKE